MGEVKKLDDVVLVTLANSIRDKNGQNSKYNPTEMPDAIKALIWRGTQEEYEAITDPDPNVLYLINNTPARDYYIMSTIEDYTSSTGLKGYGGWIPVLDRGELYTNYKYVIDMKVSGYCPARIYCVIGGSWADTSGNYPKGLFIGPADHRGDCMLCAFVVGHTNIGSSYVAARTFGRLTADQTQRAIYNVVDRSFTQIDYPTGDPNRCTDGGFFLMGPRDYSDGSTIPDAYETPNICYASHCSTTATYNSDNKVYRVTIYDESDNLLMDFVPRIVDGHKGMLDLVLDRFYPCNDDTMFIVDYDEEEEE